MTQAHLGVRLQPVPAAEHGREHGVAAVLRERGPHAGLAAVPAHIELDQVRGLGVGVRYQRGLPLPSGSEKPAWRARVD